MITKELLKIPYTLAIYAMVCFCTLGPQSLLAQGGDQILDGIGETGLIARYLFDGDVKDWSRNNLHGQIGESNVQFINDGQFGKVLSLSGDKQAFVSIPGEALGGEESLSITGWVNIRSEQLGQRIFDFGKEGRSLFYLSPTGTQDYEGYQARITNG